VTLAINQALKDRNWLQLPVDPSLLTGLVFGAQERSHAALRQTVVHAKGEPDASNHRRIKLMARWGHLKLP
jgi:hypothetical protein